MQQGRWAQQQPRKQSSYVRQGSEAGSQAGSTHHSSTHPREGAGATAPTPVAVLPSREGMPPPRTATTSGSDRISWVMF